MAEIPYLKDGTKFSAESLNSRFDAAASTVNAITAENLKRLALNPEQLPSILGPQGVSPFQFTTEVLPISVSTPTRDGNPQRVPALGGTVTFPTTSGFYLNYAPAITFAPSTGVRTGTSAITAVLVLANVEITEFIDVEVKAVPGDSGPASDVQSITLDEESWDAVVGIEIASGAGTIHELKHAERYLSPRVTMGTYSHVEGLQNMGPLRDIPGPEVGVRPHYKQFDYRTYQDVAIRTVITKDTLTPVGFDDLGAIRLYFRSDRLRGYKVQRANLTAIPILAKVNT